MDEDSPLAPYLVGLRRRAADEARRDAAWRLEARARAVSAAELLRDRFGATRVVLFGSVARGEGGPGSDVDLFVVGLRDADVLDALVAADHAMGSVAPYCDVVPEQWARPAVARRIQEEGVRLVG